MKRSLPRRESNPVRGSRGSRAGSITVKAMEDVKSLEAQRRGTPRRIGAWNVRKVKAGTGEALPGPGFAAREQPVRITVNREVAPSREGVGGGRSSGDRRGQHNPP